MAHQPQGRPGERRQAQRALALGSEESSLVSLSGGAMGVVFVTVNIIFVPMMEITNVLSAVIVGQLCLAVSFDQIGFLGIDI